MFPGFHSVVLSYPRDLFAPGDLNVQEAVLLQFIHLLSEVLSALEISSL